MMSGGTGFANYAAKACECTPVSICRFCRRSMTNHPGRGRKARQRKPQPQQSTVTVGYRAAHMRVDAARGRASSYPCVGDCGRPAAEWAYDNADPDELVTAVGGQLRRYSLDSDRYQPMCKPCHRRFDRAQRAIRIFATW
jgi:hypothetical protein